MIPRAHITAWRGTARWATDAQIEQDLVISRALVELYRDDLLARELAFRGGTALQKLHFDPPVRYSEDIDLVQVNPGPIGPVRSWAYAVPGSRSTAPGSAAKPNFSRTDPRNSSAPRCARSTSGGRGATSSISPRRFPALRILTPRRSSIASCGTWNTTVCGSHGRSSS